MSYFKDRDLELREIYGDLAVDGPDFYEDEYDPEYWDGQPDEAQEYFDFDPDC